jgi:hypothetical protein
MHLEFITAELHEYSFSGSVKVCLSSQQVKILDKTYK